MSIQVLVSTMHQTDYSLLDKMNIDSDAIVVNQCDETSEVSFDYKGHSVLWINRAERGVGLSRNTALSRATADILLFADDDVVYDDGYANAILKEYENNPDADSLFFRFSILNEERTVSEADQKEKLSIFNSTRYGAYRISVKRSRLLEAGVTFSLLFGGGAKYGSGEDSIFTNQLIRNGLKLYSVPVSIGSVRQSESTWFTGFDEKYCHDKGALMKTLYKGLYFPMMCMLILRHPEQYGKIGFFKALKEANKGAAEIR